MSGAGIARRIAEDRAVRRLWNAQSALTIVVVVSCLAWLVGLVVGLACVALRVSWGVLVVPWDWAVVVWALAVLARMVVRGMRGRRLDAMRAASLAESAARAETIYLGRIGSH